MLELNPSINRSGKRIFDQVSEAVVSHQVRKGIRKQNLLTSEDLKGAEKGSKCLTSFFTANKNTEKTTNEKSFVKSSTTIDAMSLVLFEQVLL